MLPYLAQPKRSKLRASDQDRDHTVELLRQHAGEGRLTTDELEERIELAFHAKTLGELATITADLPVDPRTTPSAKGALDAVRQSGRRRSAARLMRSIRRAVTFDLVAVLIWLAAGRGEFWPIYVIALTAIPVVLRCSRLVERLLFPRSHPAPDRSR